MRLAWALALLLCAGCDQPLQHVAVGGAVPAASPETVAGSSRATDHFSTSSGDLAFVPLEHAALLFVWRGVALYVDPTSPAIDDASLPKADLVLVTGPHYDHLDPFALQRLTKRATVVVGPPAANARRPMDITLHEGEVHRVSPGIGITAVPAYSLARGPAPGLLYQDRGQAVGYIIDFGGTRVYVSGDTECTPEQKALANVDVAFVSMNVPYAMTPAEATTCVAAFRPRVVFPYAYRHAAPPILDPTALGPGIEVRRREFYQRAAKARASAYDAFVHGMWGAADDKLDEARQLDPAGDADWRVQWTRRWLRECERMWPW
jgi:L-ascorbate metabolism protein UlaG (beta-lactamase superfamily)